MNSLVAAEWLKLRTTRLLAAILVLATGLSAAAVAGAGLATDVGRLEDADGIRHVFSVTGAGAILVLILGAVVATGEHRYGTIVDTYLTTPHRGRVIGAKLTVAAAVGMVGGLSIAAAATATAATVYAARGATLPVGATELWRILGGTIVYTALFAVLGVALGALVRNQALAIGGSLAWFAVVEHTLVNLVPSVGRWLPAGAGQAILRTPLDGVLSPAAGTTVLAAYAVALAVTAVRLEATRDV
jgi:ABC-2 type transport system permease protein